MFSLTSVNLFIYYYSFEFVFIFEVVIVGSKTNYGTSLWEVDCDISDFIESPINLDLIIGYKYFK